MHYNTLSPELGSAYDNTKEHNDSYKILKKELEGKKEIRGLGVINKGIFFGVHSDNNSQDILVYGEEDAKNYETVWIRRSGCVVVQVEKAVKEGEIAYLKPNGLFSNQGNELNPVGIFGNNSYEQNGMHIGFLEYDAFSPIEIEKDKAELGTRSSNYNNLLPAFELIFKSLEVISGVLKSIVVKPVDSKEIENLTKELETFKKSETENKPKSY